MLTRDNADAIGLRDRGQIAPGLKADLNLIDYDRLTLDSPSCATIYPPGAVDSPNAPTATP